MTTTQKRMTMIFNEWADRYSKDPDSFSNILNDNGEPVDDYGECCMRYFCEISDELDSEGKLSKFEE